MTTRPSREQETRPSREQETRPSRGQESRPSRQLETRPSRQLETRPSRQLETFPNPHPDPPPGRHYEIELEAPEFTCLCPRTGQPDFATIHVRYVPDRLCVELKSLKLYLWSYRDCGAFHEDVTNRILDDLVTALDPLEIEVVGDFKVRGGIHTVVTARHHRPTNEDSSS